MRTAAYVRYSSDKQKETSTADQLILLEALAKRHDWPSPVVYADAALSGAHIDRPSLQRLLIDADTQIFDILLLEDLSRLSRDLGETDRLLKRFRFNNVRVVCTDGFDSETEWSRMQAGLQGIMNEAYLADLARKTHRGQMGAVQRGMNAGGMPYGYKSEVVLGLHGEAIGSRKKIDPEKAEVVRRIFTRFANGSTAHQIVNELNAENIPSPRGGAWARSVVYPNKGGNVGILGNEIYIGTSIWNRSRWVKVPGSKQRKRLERPKSEWQIEHDESLRIISDELWEGAQAKIKRTGPKAGRKGTGLLTGILVCGECGSNYVTINQKRIGCAGRKERGESYCEQSATLDREDADQKVLTYIRGVLTKPDVIALFVDEVKSLQKKDKPDTAPMKKRMRDAEQKVGNIIRAIEQGVLTARTRQSLEQAEQELESAKQALEQLERQRPMTDVDPMALYRLIMDRLDQVEDRMALRSALKEALGTVTVVADEGGASLRFDSIERILHRLIGDVENNGSGGRIKLFSN